MTNLLVWKEYIKSFYAKYEDFILPVLKFLFALLLFSSINGQLGYMERINSPVIVLVAALLCSFLPLGFMVFLCAVFLLAHVYALSLECMAVLLLAYLFIAVVYLRFSPKGHLLLMLTPLFFCWHIPYVLPLAAGLFGSPASAVPVACGVVLYYVLNYMTGNAPALGAADADSPLQRFQDVATGVLENREMIIVAVAFSVTVILVYIVRRMSVSYARAIAVLVGALTDVVILLVGDLMYDANFSIGSVIFGSLLGAVAALVMQFFHFSLDYARTEKVQFEDEEYYYYVKAVPKMAVTVPEKRVKKITARKGHQGARRGHGRAKAKNKGHRTGQQR